MLFSLFEIFQQIDPYVNFTDGQRIGTAGRILIGINPDDLTDHVLTTDSAGRLLVYRLDARGRMISPPCFVELKANDLQINLGNAPVTTDFGKTAYGYV